MELRALISIIQQAEARSEALEAIRRLIEEYRDQAAYELDRILADERVSTRARGIVLYFLDSHGALPEVRGKYMADPQLRRMADLVEQAIEGDEEEGVTDPFAVKDDTANG